MSSIKSVMMAALIAASPLAQSGVLFQSTFNASTEGWTALTTTSGNPSVPVTWNASVGNPAGSLQHVAPSDNALSFFLAPSALLSALHGASGGLLSWDISTVKGASTDTFVAALADVFFEAGNLRLRRSLVTGTIAQSPAWQSFSTGFTVADGWDLLDSATGSSALATQSQIDALMNSATTLGIRGEFWSGTLADITYLDNVVLSTPTSVPAPGMFALLGLGTLVLSGLRSSRRRSIAPQTL